MGIGINNNSDSVLVSAAKVGAGAGLIGAGVAAAPYAKKSFSDAIQKQADLIDKFQKSGQTVDEYVNVAKRKINAVSSPSVTYKTVQNWTKKGLSEKEIIEKITKMNNDAAEINKIGTEKALKQLDKSKKLFETGKTSKLDAAKDAAVDVLKRAKGKAVDFKDGVVNAFKSTEGGMFDKLKAVKANSLEFLNANPSIKKGGKAALIAAAGIGAITLISKAVKAHKKAE